MEKAISGFPQHLWCVSRWCVLMRNGPCARWSPECCARLSDAGPKACSIFSCLQKFPGLNSSKAQPCRDFDFTVTFGILQNCQAILGIFYTFYLSITTEPWGPRVLRLPYYHINLRNLAGVTAEGRVYHITDKSCNSWCLEYKYICHTRTALPGFSLKQRILHSLLTAPGVWQSDLFQNWSRWCFDK